MPKAQCLSGAARAATQVCLTSSALLSSFSSCRETMRQQYGKVVLWEELKLSILTVSLFASELHYL